MTTSVLVSKLSTVALPVLFVLSLGMGVLFMAGHAQSAALHDAAHDARHSTGFPCH